MATSVRAAWACGATGRSAGAGASPVRRVPWVPLALTVAAYLAGSLALHHRLLPQLTTATAGWTSSDSYQFVWWIRWLPWSLAHGADPLYTTYLHAPPGVNGMWNTPVPVLATLFAPVTLTAGPVAAYNVAMILGPVVSGIALVLALGVWVERWWPRAAAGLLYGFCPILRVVAHSSVGRLNLVWAVLPPAMLWLLHTLLVAPRPRPWRTGALVGLAFVAGHPGVHGRPSRSPAVVLVVLAVMLVLRRPGEALRRTPDVLRAAAACLGMYAVLCACALPLLAGPGALACRDPPDRGDRQLRRRERAGAHRPQGIPAGDGRARRAAAHALGGKGADTSGSRRWRWSSRRC